MQHLLDSSLYLEIVEYFDIYSTWSVLELKALENNPDLVERIIGVR